MRLESAIISCSMGTAMLCSASSLLSLSAGIDLREELVHGLAALLVEVVHSFKLHHAYLVALAVEIVDALDCGILVTGHVARPVGRV